VNLRVVGRAIRLIATWRFRGEGWPHPFFDRKGRAPSRPVTVLPRAARDALRSFCGPDPTARARA
jgi:hypothetical protein